MAYKRKTYDEFELQCDYGYGWECVTTEETFKEARAQKKCYLENDPRPYRIVKKRVRIEQ